MKLIFFRGILLNGDPGGFVFFEADCQERGLKFSFGGCDLQRNYGLVIFNYDNLTLKLHQENRSYPNERVLFIGRFKVGIVPGKSAALVTITTKKV